jgi:CRISPR-associated exonuclease Cas4
MTHITATYINLYHICHRELWLHAHEIRMEHTSDTVREGKLIGEASYADRPDKNRELEIGGVKIDHYDPKTNTVYEVKKSDKVETAHEAQVKFYLWVLEKHGIPEAKGIIEYPRLRERQHVSLSEEDRKSIRCWMQDIDRIISSDTCPAVIRLPICKQCSYYDYCYIDEP